MVMDPNRYAFHHGHMPSITVRNIPDDVYERLRERAAAHRRSLNSEIVACLEQSLTRRPVDPVAFRAFLRPLHEKTASLPLTDALLRQAKDKGRP